MVVVIFPPWSAGSAGTSAVLCPPQAVSGAMSERKCVVDGRCLPFEMRDRLHLRDTLATIDASLLSLCASFLPHTQDQSAYSHSPLPFARGPPCVSNRTNTRRLTSALCAPPPARIGESLVPRCCLSQAVRASLHVQLSAKPRNGDVGSTPASARCLPLVFSGGWYELGWAVRTLLSVPSPERLVPSASVSAV